MSFSGGVFSINTSGQPVVSGTTISASVFNAFTADIATGLSTCMLKDGTQTATAGIGFYAGTVSLPGIYFGTDTATGFYRIGLNNTGFAINGTKLLDMSSASFGITGLLDISAATSGQIKFPASQNASANANTLDDYEEGTFTPALTLGSGSVTYTTQNGLYTKIGNLVTVQGRVTVNVATTPGGSLTITGLPFTANATQCGAVSVSLQGFTGGATTAIEGFVNGSAATISLLRFSGGGANNDLSGALQNSAVIDFTASYNV